MSIFVCCQAMSQILPVSYCILTFHSTGEETQLLDCTDSFQVTLPDYNHFEDSLTDDFCDLPNSQHASHCDKHLEDSLCEGDDMDDTQLEDNKQSLLEPGKDSLNEEAATEDQDASRYGLNKVGRK